MFFHAHKQTPCKMAPLCWPRRRHLWRRWENLATFTNNSRSPRRENAYMAAVPRAVRRAGLHNLGGILEVSGRTVTPLQPGGTNPNSERRRTSPTLIYCDYYYFIYLLFGGGWRFGPRYVKIFCTILRCSILVCDTQYD